MADVTTDAMGLVKALHVGDTVAYARIWSRVRRTQYGAPVTRELVELLLSLLDEIHDNDHAAVQRWLDKFDTEYQRMNDEDRHG